MLHNEQCVIRYNYILSLKITLCVSEFCDHEPVSMGDKSVQYVPFIDTVHRNILLLSADETLLVLKQRLSQGGVTLCDVISPMKNQQLPSSPLTPGTRRHHDRGTFPSPSSGFPAQILCLHYIQCIRVQLGSVWVHFSAL